MQEGEKPGHNFLLYALILSCFVTIGSSFYYFYYLKNYDFVAEVACDNTKESCFIRDCSDPELCPMNELTTFKRYHIRAGDFSACTNEDCALACESGAIKCELEECADNIEAGESCSFQPAEDVLPQEEQLIDQ